MTTAPPQHGASTRSTIVRSVGVLAGSEFLGRAAAFAATAYLARRLGPEGFGILGFATALCGYLALAVQGGLPYVGAREVARAPDRATDLYASVSTIRLCLAAVAMALLAVVAVILPKSPVTSLVVFLSGLSFFSLALDPTWVFRGLERPALAGAWLVVSQSLYALGVLLVVSGPSDVVLVPILQFVGELVAALALCVVLFRHARPRLAIAEGWRLLQSAGYLGLATVFRTLVVSSDMVLLGFMATNRQVGLYNAAYRIVFLLMSVAASTNIAYLPSYARVVQGDARDTRRLVETSTAMATLIGAPLVAGVMVTARPLIALLFGADYTEATSALQLLALSVGMVFLYSCVTNLLIAANRTRLFAVVHGVAAALNIALNLLLIPRFGIEGAAGATLTAEAAVLVFGVLILRRMDALPSPRSVLAPLAAAAAMGMVVLGIGRAWPLAAQIALGAVAYASVVTLFGGLPPTLLSRIARRPTRTPGH